MYDIHGRLVSPRLRLTKPGETPTVFLADGRGLHFVLELVDHPPPASAGPKAHSQHSASSQLRAAFHRFRIGSRRLDTSGSLNERTEPFMDGIIGLSPGAESSAVPEAMSKREKLIMFENDYKEMKERVKGLEVEVEKEKEKAEKAAREARGQRGRRSTKARAEELAGEQLRILKSAMLGMLRQAARRVGLADQMDQVLATMQKIGVEQEVHAEMAEASAPEVAVDEKSAAEVWEYLERWFQRRAKANQGLTTHYSGLGDEAIGRVLTELAKEMWKRENLGSERNVDPIGGVLEMTYDPFYEGDRPAFKAVWDILHFWLADRTTGGRYCHRCEAPVLWNICLWLDLELSKQRSDVLEDSWTDTESNKEESPDPPKSESKGKLKSESETKKRQPYVEDASEQGTPKSESWGKRDQPLMEDALVQGSPKPESDGKKNQPHMDDESEEEEEL